MIVITTPTGQIGHQILDKILDSGEPIRVIARDPSRLAPHVRERVEVVQGSSDDLDIVTEAFAGADCVFWLVPPNPQTDSPRDYYLDFTRLACEAIKRQGVKRVVTVTSLGHEFGKNAGLLSAAFAMDDLIESTGVSYRALRMPFFMENLLNQVEAITSCCSTAPGAGRTACRWSGSTSCRPTKWRRSCPRYWSVRSTSSRSAARRTKRR